MVSLLPSFLPLLSGIPIISILGLPSVPSVCLIAYSVLSIISPSDFLLTLTFGLPPTLLIISAFNLYQILQFNYTGLFIYFSILHFQLILFLKYCVGSL